MSINPIIKSDYPDPDVIRVEDTYYMASTTMYFFPGCAILRSYDLVNWEIAGYVFESLDDSPEERLEHELSSYGGGMWAPCLRYHEGTFYVLFVSHFSQTTYLFTAKDPCGKWEKRTIEGYYHDCSLLFDGDRRFLISGNTQLWLTELKEDLSGPIEGGINKVIIDQGRIEGLGYEGSHLYKINGKYYLFCIHWPKGSMRTEICFVSDNIEGPYEGKDILCDDRNYCHQGVAQGGIVDTPGGKWYAVLFQDSGAVGRIPVLVPVHFENDFPVLGVNGKVPERFEVASTRPYYRYEPVYTSKFFDEDAEWTDEKHPVLRKPWQWNHIPQMDLWEGTQDGKLKIRTGKICSNLTHAVNCLTQRTMLPKCEAEVTVDARGLKDGDVTGLCLLQGCYAYLALSKEGGYYYLIKVVRNKTDGSRIGEGRDYLPGEIVEKIKLDSPVVTLCLKANFEKMADRLAFFYLKDDKFIRLGENHQMKFGLDHFTGARFGLFIFSTRGTGGEAVFSDFEYRYYD